MNVFVELAEWLANLLATIGVLVALYTLVGIIRNKISRKNKLKYLKIWLTLLTISFVICFITFFISLILGDFNVANIIINILRLIAIYIVIEVIRDVKWEK